MSNKTPSQTPKPAPPKPGTGFEKGSKEVPRPDYKPPSNPPQQGGGK